MTSFLNKLTLILFSIFLSSCSASEKSGQYRGYETTNYQVKETFNNIEIRQYPSFLAAEVEVEGSRKEAAKKGFLILAKYIFGKNIAKEKVAMTSPVNQQEKSQKIAMTSPVRQSENSDKNWVIQFTMPKEFTIDTLPTPENDKIKFKQIASKKVISIRFTGGWNDKNLTENKQKLMEFISEKKLTKIGSPIISYYDDPFTFPWNRRNEIIQEIK